MNEFVRGTWQRHWPFAYERKKKKNNSHVAWVHERIEKEPQLDRVVKFRKLMETRRTVRFFSQDEVPEEIIKECIMTAGCAPSGAHLQPWTFVVVCDGEIKMQIREAVEIAEKENYTQKMGKKWVKDVESMVSHLHKEDIQKPYLTEAPYLIIIMEHKYQLDEKTNTKKATYYSSESCGIAAGILIAAIQNANLMTLTSTPLGAGEKLRQILKRPDNERVYLLMPVGYPADDCTVPYRTGDKLRKPLDEIMEIV
eukprot:TRINITY_DN4570_c2_g2_i1.p1 TRINITY_DN4570_c2_g2~~TRINITY_DN4570_c2_g2_i1.p1  ORF type:complete len:263 (-),score=29.58 TRINITY_DN4570_c2_g2_i1:790-1551(-)